MHRSARTAHTMRPSRSGSSTIQPATGQAAWQIEHANAPKQRSGSITAIVFGAFLRGPDIIFVHIAEIIAERAKDPPGDAAAKPGGVRRTRERGEGGSAHERLTDRRLAVLGHDAPERRGVFVDRVIGI